jgi:hypothetical protein
MGADLEIERQCGQNFHSFRPDPRVFPHEESSIRLRRENEGMNRCQ